MALCVQRTSTLPVTRGATRAQRSNARKSFFSMDIRLSFYSCSLCIFGVGPVTETSLGEIPPVRIRGPLLAISVWPSGDTQIAATLRIPSTKPLPFSGPTSNKVVERASEAVPVLATTLRAYLVFKGTPVSGSMMWPADSFPRRLLGVCSEVETLFSHSMTWGSILLEGSLKCTSHPACPGGEPIP